MQDLSPEMCTVIGLPVVGCRVRVSSSVSVGKERICLDEKKRQGLAHLMTATYPGRQPNITRHRCPDSLPMIQHLRSSVMYYVSDVRKTTSKRAQRLRR